MRDRNGILAVSATWIAVSALIVPRPVGAVRGEYFTPSHRLTGIGADRGEISEAVLAKRTELMIDSQTFSIMREPQAVAGARRISSPKLQRLFQDAARRTGFPASLIAAIAYLESWGDSNAVSPAGPKGIMQISEATAKRIGLRVFRATRYKVTTERRLIRSRKGRPGFRVYRRRIPYTVTLRDERLIPEKAVAAAARYLSQMEERLGGRDLAIFAYHCGEGCVSEFLSIAEQTAGIKKLPITVPRMFFCCSPAHNQEMYYAIRRHMERDYSPTYYFRIKRAEQLLSLYQSDPQAFVSLATEYKNQFNPRERAPHRLSVWLKAEDLAFQSCEDLKKEQGKKLVRALENPRLFGFVLRKSGAGAIAAEDLANQEYYLQASPSAIGTLIYIAFETRRLHEAMKPKGESYVPLEVTALVRPLDYGKNTPGWKNESPAHCTGQVFDISYGNLPAGERECLEFVLGDMGWDGYLGFIQESAENKVLHIGCSPSSREFFTRIFQEALADTS